MMMMMIQLTCSNHVTTTTTTMMTMTTMMVRWGPQAWKEGALAPSGNVVKCFCALVVTNVQ